MKVTFTCRFQVLCLHVCWIATLFLGAATFSGPPLAGQEAVESGRFDLMVRELFFAGFGGDERALEKGMTICAEALARNPQHAEALVWQGSGKLYRAGILFSRAEFEKALPLWQQGLAEMDRAVAMKPKSLGVRVPRGASLLGASRHTPPDQTPNLVKHVIEDYAFALDFHATGFEKLGVHNRGELLGGLAEAWARAGDPEKARPYVERMTRELPGTPYAERAKLWLEAASTEDRPNELACIGCHSRE